MPNGRVVWRHQIMLAELRYWELTRRFRIQVPGSIWSTQGLRIDLPLQGHKRLDQGFRSRRATGDVHIDRQKTVDTFEHVVALFERPAGNRASSHGDHIFGLRHLVEEPHHLRRHFLGHRACDNHQVGLPGRGAKDLGAETGEVIAGHGGGNHLDRTASQTKLERPDGTSAAPVVQILELHGKYSLFAQLASQAFVHSAYFQFKIPFIHAQANPSTRSKRKTIIAKNAPKVKPENATAKGSRKMVSTSKIRNRIA